MTTTPCSGIGEIFAPANGNDSSIASLMDSPSLVGGVVVTEVCHEGESARHARARRSRTERVSILLTFLSGVALYLPDLPLVASCVLCLVSIAASLTGIWSLFAYRMPFFAIHGASVPSDFDPSLGVHGANSTECAADKHVC